MCLRREGPHPPGEMELLHIMGLYELGFAVKLQNLTTQPLPAIPLLFFFPSAFSAKCFKITPIQKISEQQKSTPLSSSPACPWPQLALGTALLSFLQLPQVSKLLVMPHVSEVHESSQPRCLSMPSLISCQLGTALSLICPDKGNAHICFQPQCFPRYCNKVPS